MKNQLKALYDVTKQLEKVFKQPISSTNRASVIKQVNQLIEQRGTYLKEIVPPFTKEEQEIGKELIVLNEYIQKEMKLLFGALKIEMQQVKKQKQSNQSYTNPYENVGTMDGMFLDNKL